MFSYEKNPGEIYRQSFNTIEAEAELSRFSDGERQLVVRLVHACGMVDLADDVIISTGAIEAGCKALECGASIICDVEMVRRGIIERHLAKGNQISCGLNLDEAKDMAARFETTRSAGGLEALRQQIAGSIVAIGNAPTALFHLLEMIQDGLPAPALIIGCPVGFVGAVESKEALIEVEQMNDDLSFVTVRGRRGGSAMAAAAVNALAILSGGNSS